jgi:hypothetical protein
VRHAEPSIRSGPSPGWSALAGAALTRALAFLRSVQLPSGEFPVYTANDPGMGDVGEADPSIFPTALAAHSLSFCQEAAPLRERALGFLAGEMDAYGLWRHWTRAHPHSAELPPDLDDTSCASAALADRSLVRGNREILLGNRRTDGLFYTWILPRLGRTGAAHRRATWLQLRHAATLFFFFRRTSARPGDVDAVVNANALFYLGGFDKRAAVVEFLMDVLRHGSLADCDKWYENPFAVLYFMSRALAGEPQARALIEARAASAVPANALETALALCTAMHRGERPSEADIRGLIALQAEDGSWPRAALYHGGRLRRASGGFAPRHPDTPHWGSEALTTAFCVEALSRAAGEP